MDNSSLSKDLSEEKLTRFAVDKRVSAGELEALKLALLKKQKSKEIAAALDISEAAARKRLGEVYRKFDIQGRGPGKLASLKAMLMSADERDRNQNRIDQVVIGDSLDEAPAINGFVGRKAPLAELERWIISSVKGHKLLAICGIGGMGKTWLTRKLVEAVGDRFQAVVWLSIDPDRSPLEQLSKLLDGLRATQSPSSTSVDPIVSNELASVDIDLQPKATQLIEQILGQMSAGRCLVVLDGYERLFVSQSKDTNLEKAGLEKAGRQKGDSDRAKGQKHDRYQVDESTIEQAIEQAIGKSGTSGRLALEIKGDRAHLSKPLLENDLLTSPLAEKQAISFESENNLSEEGEALTLDLQLPVVYRPGFEVYGQLLSAVKSSAASSSCVVVTSREKPPEAMADSNAVRLYKLGRLDDAEAQELLGSFHLKDLAARQTLIERYCGHPMALMFAANTIKDVFFGSIQDFLDQEISVYYDLESVLRTQIKRLSPIEKESMYWLAINHRACTLEDLRSDILSEAHKERLPYVLKSLERRSLVEVKRLGRSPSDSPLFSLHPIVSEYVLDRFVRKIFSELKRENLQIFNQHALMKADAEDSLREFQKAKIVRPILARLKRSYHSLHQVDEHLSRLLSQFRENYAACKGYAGGNFINLLVQLSKGELTRKDFSQMTIWQAYLQGVQLREVDLRRCQLDRTIFTETLGDVTTVSLSHFDATAFALPLLAAGDTRGVVHLWHTHDLSKSSGQKFCEWMAHSGWIRTVVLGSYHKMPLLVTGGDDNWLKLWLLPTPEQLAIQPEQLWQQSAKERIYAIALNPKGNLIATGGDSKLTLYDTQTGRELYSDELLTLTDSAQRPAETVDVSAVEDAAPLDNANKCGAATLKKRIQAIAFSPDGQWLAAEGENHTICLRPVRSLLSGKPDCAKWPVLLGHTETIHSLVFSPDGQQLISGSEDRKICVWDVDSQTLKKALYRPGDSIRSVAISDDGRFLASAGDDCQITLWDLRHYRLLRDISTGNSRVSAVSFQRQQDKLLLAAGGDRQMLKLWQITADHGCSELDSLPSEPSSSASSSTLKVEPLKTYRGYTNGIRAIAFIGENRIISGGDDRDLSVWDTQFCERKARLSLHHGRIWAIAVDRENNRIASASDDHTVRLWDAATSQCLIALPGHRNWVRTVAFSQHGQFLASSGDDCTIRIWNTASGYCLKTLERRPGEKSYWIRSVAFNPQNARYLVSGGDDPVVKLWDRKEGWYKPLSRHQQRIYAVAYSPDGRWVASGSADATVMLWDLDGECVRYKFDDPDMSIQTIAFSPDGQYLAAGGEDQVVYVWDVQAENPEETCFIFRPQKPIDLSGGIRAISFSPDGKFIVSGGLDEIIRIGAIEQITTGNPGVLGVMIQRDRPYENVEIANIKGLSTLQKASLMTLGAVDETQSLLT